MSKVLVVAILSSLLFACGGGDADRPETPASVASIEVPGLTEHSVAVGSVTVQVEKGGGFFHNQTFYRVDPKFVIVSGDPTKSGDGDAGYSTPLEASTVRNRRGTLSVGARPSGTVGSQFFINVVDNKHLDFDNPRADKYYPFAEVTSGLDVVDAIAAGAPGAVSILHATLKPE